MTKNWIFRGILVLLLIIGSAAISWAQPMDAPGGPDGAGPEALDGMPPMEGADMEPRAGGRTGQPPSPERMEKVRKRVEMVRIWKLTEALELDDKTADRLFPIIRKYDKKKMVLQKERFQLRRQMRQLKSGSSIGKVDHGKLLESVEKNRSAMYALDEAQRAEMKKVLTSEQMLKYFAFEEKFRREMKQMMRDARNKRGSGGMRGNNREGFNRGGDRGPGGGPPAGMEEGGAPVDRRRR